jgi:NADH-quinone oxidoreductase subunit L
LGNHAEVIDSNTELMLMIASVSVALMGILAAIFIYSKESNVPVSNESPRGMVITIMYHKFYVDEMYDTLIVRPILGLGDIAFHIIEFLVIDLAVNLVGMGAKGVGSFGRKLQQGTVGFYMFAMVIGIVVFLFLGYFQLYQAGR